MGALQEDLADIVSSSAELSNTQAAKVISYRAEQHSALELVDFLTFFNDSWAFVIKCETICRRMIVGLRGTVVGQVSHFIVPASRWNTTLISFSYCRPNYFSKLSTRSGYHDLQNLLRMSFGIQRKLPLTFNKSRTSSLTPQCETHQTLLSIARKLSSALTPSVSRHRPQPLHLLLLLCSHSRL
jgi:hypothetical protein